MYFFSSIICTRKNSAYKCRASIFCAHIRKTTPFVSRKLHFALFTSSFYIGSPFLNLNTYCRDIFLINIHKLSVFQQYYIFGILCADSTYKFLMLVHNSGSVPETPDCLSFFANCKQQNPNIRSLLIPVLFPCRFQVLKISDNQ